MTRFKRRMIAPWLLASVVFAGCGYSEEEMQAKQAQIDELTQQLQDAEQRHQSLQAKFNQLQKENEVTSAQLKKMGINAAQLREERGALQKMVEELEAKQARARARLGTFRNMIKRFQKMIDSGKLRVRISRGRMVVELAENILFDSGRARLRKEGQEALKQVAEVLKTIPKRNFQIEGHTDNVPIRGRRFGSNWHLSTARAVNVTRFLAEHGVPEQRLSAAGYADTQPVASNDTAEGRQKNRRIEIVLMPNLDELPDLSALEKDLDE